MSFKQNLRSISFSTLAFATFGSAAVTQAEEFGKGVYVNLGIGSGTYSDIVWSDGLVDTFDFGFGFEAGLGYDFGKRFRTELTYSKLNSEHDGTGNDAQFGSIIFNGFIDFPIEDTKFTPFLGLGFGTTNVDAVDLCTAAAATDCEDDVATFSFSGGLAYSLNDSTELTGKLTYLGFDDISMNNNGTAFTVLESETFTFSIGARVKF